MQALIEANGLSAAFDGQNALENVNFCVEKGEMLCVLGGSGSGKSTLVRCLQGLLRPSAGEIRFAQGLSHADIGYLPQQDGAPLDFPSSVQQIVRGGLLSRKRVFTWLSRTDKLRVENAMKQTSVFHLAQRRFAELSGGQKQRVLIARALCASNGVLMLDDPAVGLDAGALAEFFQTVRLVHSLGTTVILTTNDADTAARYGSHILQLEAGRVLFDGSARQFNEGRAK